jgi:K+ transporter
MLLLLPQALITGSFSIVSQSMAMGCFPRLHVKHTNAKVGGQIYIAGACAAAAGTILCCRVSH